MTNTLKAAKAMAKHLTKALQDAGQMLPHSNALEVVAKAYGARTWNAFVAAQPETQSLAPAKSAATATPAKWSPKLGPMTQAQFMANALNGGCPVCGSDDIEGGSFDVDGAEASQEVSCKDCHAGWVESYSLSSYFITEGAETALFLQRVESWIRAEKPEVDGSELDELVTDMFIDDNLEDINSTDDDEDQETCIANAESRSSNVNNEGLFAQLLYLFNGYSSKKELIEALAETLEISPKSFAG